MHASRSGLVVIDGGGDGDGDDRRWWEEEDSGDAKLRQLSEDMREYWW